MQNTEENSEKNWKTQKKRKLNSEMIWKINMEENSDQIWTIQKK